MSIPIRPVRFIYRLIPAIALAVFLSTPALAQNIESRWALGLRGGFSVLVDDYADGLEGELGPAAAVDLSYGLSDSVSWGLRVEWEKHQAETGSLDLGDFTTISPILFLQVRRPNAEIAPYVQVGVGYNLNTFSTGEDFPIFAQACLFTIGIACTDLEPDDSIALLLGGGIDFFMTPHLAFNADIGWKYNSGDQEILTASGPVGEDDFKASAIRLLFGVQYYF